MDVVWTALITSVIGTAVTYSSAEGMRWYRSRRSADHAPLVFAHSATNGLWVLTNESRRHLLAVSANCYGSPGYQDLLSRTGRTLAPGETVYIWNTIDPGSTVFFRWATMHRKKKIEYFGEPVKIEAEIPRYAPRRRTSPPPEWGG